MLGLVLALVAGSSWWLTRLSEQTPPGLLDAQRRPDYFAKGFVTRQFDEQGQLIRLLEVKELEHFPHGDATQVREPRMTLVRDVDRWQIRASSGRISRGGDLILLEGEVHIEREAQGQTPPIVVHTRDLLIFNDISMAETNQQTRIESGQNWIRADGMRLWYAQETRLKLVSNVRGRYEIE